MKPDEPVFKLIQIQNLMRNDFSLLHHDDYLEDNVELTTFTPQDDILIKTLDRIMIFDLHGNQLKVNID